MGPELALGPQIGKRSAAALPAAVSAVVFGLCGFEQWLIPAHRSISRLVLAGRFFVDPTRAPRGLYIRPGTGYDGQSS